MERYLITTESYIYAENEAKAKSLAGYVQGKQRKQSEQGNNGSRSSIVNSITGDNDRATRRSTR